VRSIRPARPDELEAIGRLTVAAYLPTLALDEDDRYRATLADAAGRATAAELLVAADDSRIVGTVALCRPGTPYAEVATSDELEVRMLAIAPTAQRAGVGSALMQHVHAVADQEGFTGIVLSVVDTNVRAAAFYRSLGYERQPQRDWTPVPHVHLLVWRRSTGPTPSA
jgi:ribosomal protein S18 acetylase RimI-like enzyme